MRRLLSFLLKAAISALLFYVALRRVDLGGVVQRLGAIDPRWLCLVLAVLCVQIALNAMRWREVVAICGARLSATTALRYTFIGQFFSQVLPSTVGGDAARIWLLARDGAGWPTAIYSVLIDRVVGATCLAALVALCLPWTLQLVHDPVAQGGLIVIGLGALFAAAVFLGLGIPGIGLMQRWWITRHLAAASRLAWKLSRSTAGLRVGVIAFGVHALTVLAAWSAARAGHASVELAQTLFVVLPVVLLSTVPISIAGWGVRESMMVLAFSAIGLASSDGLIVSLLLGAGNLAAGALGGVVWVASGYRWRSVQNLEADTRAHSHDDDVPDCTARRPAAFLDRDGVLNVDRGYVYQPEALEWIAGAPQAVRLLNEAGFAVIVVTNQSGIARGKYTEADMHAFHAVMQQRLRAEGAHIDAFYFCPHHPDGSVVALAIPCDCRKPGTGMLEQAAREWPLDLRRSFLIGDKDSDMTAAAAFHIPGVRFDANRDSLLDLVRRQIATTVT